MSSVESQAKTELEHLCVDAFLANYMDAQALGAAVDLGIIECLETEMGHSAESLRDRLRLDARVLPVLVDLLTRADVLCSGRDGELALSTRFRRALQFRDLLLAKLDFARVAAVDLISDFGTLVRSPREFMSRAKMFRLFSYGRCFESTPENVELTKRWVRITTALTRYEAPGCFQRYDIARHRRMLDIGGNSGEFAIQACRLNAELRATVVDLPVVCEIGREHVAATPEGERINFVSANAMVDALPIGSDLVTFKSVLHDWPDLEARELLRRGWNALVPGGTLLVYERAKLRFLKESPSFAIAPIVAFAHSYRQPEFYEVALREMGVREIAVSTVEQDVPFLLLAARKG